MLCDTILGAVGKTPLVKLNRIGKNIPASLYVKCEFLNPGGSLKDRIAKQMLLDAEQAGRIKRGDTIIEATSGNTGIGLAMAGAVLGYKIVITMPEKMSHEKEVVLKALGAEIIRTPTDVPYSSPASHIEVAKKLQQERPNAHILDQYSNASNPKAHYTHTAQEIIADLGKQVDMLVVAAGTGGSISGLAKRIKEHNPDAQIVGVDPEGSILGGGDEVCAYQVEGIGYDFVPKVLSYDDISVWDKTTDKESFAWARRLIKEEGLLVGGSSGAVIAATLRHAAHLAADQNCVAILPDGVRNYLTKFISDNWMQEHNLMD
ncbi:MAG: pyridoxal-phosphate dependent enzyme [Pseudomonadota bacterium]|nr:pyridoxal-phosphate dependent enzyme [Pseudomonadota bacterium]